MGVSGVKADVWSNYFSATLGPYPGFQLVKLCNQAGSNRHFQAGLRRQQGTGYPDYKINLYYNLQIRRGTNSPTLLDWYICEYQPGTAMIVQPQIELDPAYASTYKLFFNGASFGTYSWYTTGSNTAGTWATNSEMYAASGGKFDYIRIFENRWTGDGFMWYSQNTAYPCEFVFNEPYPWSEKTIWELVRANDRWWAVSVW